MAKKKISKKVTFKGENNPFNLKLNREKHTVLGQKAKGTKGLRSISRANSHLKRKELYNKTRKTFEKANSFVDRRLLDESAEDSITARFVQERKKKLKKNKFNLNDDDDDLTHKGVPLHALKKLNHDQPSSDDDDDNEQLDAAFVKKAHFGGFASGLNQEPPSHKEIINQLILDSKQQKHEKKMEKELALELNETMKQNWRATYGKVTSKTNQKSVEIKKLDSLSESDNIQAMLKLTMQKPSVISETNQKSTETLEWKSLAQMTKYSIKGTPSVHTKSAEELNQEEEKKQLELEQERCQRMVDNKEIKANSKNHLSADSILDDFDFEPMVVEENINEKYSDSDKDSDYSDGDESVDSDTSEFISGNDKVDIELNSQNNLTNDIDESINLPTSIEELEKLLKVPFHTCNKDTFEKTMHILKPFFKSKSEAKLSKLANFFGVLLECVVKHMKSQSILSENLSLYLYDIAEVMPVETSERMLFFIDEEQKIFQKCKSMKKKSSFPRYQCLLLLKYCSVLYSVSDFIHPVITPAILFMCDILSCKFFITLQNIESRLIVCNIIRDSITQSKRLVPEVICFLNKVLHLAKKFTFSSKDSSSLQIKHIELFHYNDKLYCDNSRKLSIILTSLNLLQDFATFYAHLPSFYDLFSETLSVCSDLLTLSNEFCEIYSPVSALIEKINQHSIPLHLTKLTFENMKPKPLKLFEPSYESKFNKQDSINKKLKILKNVAQKIRKEEKDMLREMRRDLQVVSAEKFKEQLESDIERKRKVKELYHDLATQEGEYKKLMKKNP